MNFQPRFWTATQWLIGVNVAIFVLDLLFQHQLMIWGDLRYDLAIANLQIWRLITFQFLHVNGAHILFNMITLYFFGPLIEGMLGKKRFVGFYLMCGVAGGGLFLLISKFGLLHLHADSPLIGASAGILGIMGAAARIMPNLPVRLIIFPMKLFTLVLIYVGLAGIFVIAGGENVGGELSHLGGAALGFFMGNYLQGFSRWGISGPKRKFWKPGQDNFLRDDVDA